MQQQFISTTTLAGQVDRDPASIRTAVWRKGHFYGIVPVKMSPGKSGRLLWPADTVARIIAAAGGAK